MFGMILAVATDTSSCRKAGHFAISRKREIARRKADGFA